MMGFWDAVASAGHMQAIAPLQTDNHTNSSSLNFYRPNLQRQSTEDNTVIVCLQCKFHKQQLNIIQILQMYVFKL